MQASVLQSMLQRNSRAITQLEWIILREKSGVRHYYRAKEQDIHYDDIFNISLKRLNRNMRELAALVKIQKSLKQELARDVGRAALYKLQSEHWVGCLP